MPLRDLETWMWAEACEMLDRAERLNRQFFKPAVMTANQPAWEPPIDIYESSSEYKIVVALPGVASEQLRIMQEGDYLIITGQRHLPTTTDADTQIRRIEIPYGRFERRIKLAFGKFIIGNTACVNGCLLISLLKQ